MLGYIRTNSAELRLRDYECYRALYCGLCRHMGKCTGQCSRLSLSYDFVFLAAVRMSLLGEAPKLKKKRCLIHPLQKRKTAVDSETLRYCADASALLSYQKCRDDLMDERGLKKLRARFASWGLFRGYRKAKRRHPALDAAIAEHLLRLQAYEKDTSLPPSADAPAEIFGDLMAAVFAEGLEGKDARIAAAIGRPIGHWIYLVDAADDFEKDRKSGAFNPYLRLFGETLEPEECDLIRPALTRFLSDAECGLLLIDDYPMEELKEILCNILYLGLPQTAQTVIQEKLKGEPKTNENSL